MKKSKKVTGSITQILCVACILLYIAFCAMAFMITAMNAQTTIRTRVSSVGALTSGILSDFIAERRDSLTRVSADPGAAAFLMNLRKNGEGIFTDPAAADMLTLMRTADNVDTDVKYAFAALADSGVVVGDSEYLTAAEYDIKAQKWFKTAVTDLSNFGLTPLHKSIFNEDETVFSIIEPISENGNVIGWFGIEVSPEKLGKLLETYIDSGYSFPIIFSDDHSVIYAPFGNTAFSSLYDVNQPPIASFIAGNSSENPVVLQSNWQNSDTGETVYYYLDSTQVPNWSVLVVFDTQKLDGGMTELFWIEISVLLCLVALFFIIVNEIIRNRLKLIVPITETIEDFVAGNYKARVNSDNAGQLGSTARAIDAIGKELSDKKQAAEILAYLDPVTGLQNRVRLYECVDEHIVRRNNVRKEFAILFIDLDNFKWLNETYGHKFGDDALSVFAKVLSDTVTPEAQIFRYSGDEFIIVYDFEEKSELESFAGKLRNAYGKPFHVQNDSIYFRFSCGIAVYPENGLTTDDMLRQAASALSNAKSSGRNKNSYVPAETGLSPKKAYIAQVLTHALHNRELYLNYQPIISIETGEIYGFEALLRWENAEFGNIPPADFIKIAEESGEIVQIGMWILENACRFIKRVNSEYDRDIVISVNVSPVQLHQHDYIAHIRNVIAISHIKPQSIVLELTEGNLVDFIDNKNETLEEVISTGITLALDDFGTGYSSMSYLKNLPVKVLKINQEFVKNMADEKGGAITSSTIELVHSLGLVIVAEGIETREQYDSLKAKHCDFIQGYLFSKPLDEEKAMEFIPQYEQIHGVE
jgi:diguanylate cyclase (GGDEF)-like protein